VQVVNLAHPGRMHERLADGVGVQSLGGGFEEHAPGVAQQPVGGAQHDRGDDQRGDAVGAMEAREQDDRARDRGEDEGGKVGEDVLEGALDVHRRPVGLRERPRGGEVHDDADQRHDQHGGAADVGRVHEAPDALHDDDEAEDEQGRAVELGGEDLGPLVAVGHRALRRFGREADGDQRERDGAGVGEHVRGIRQQRE
jgi:hypothetical protein